MQKDAQFASVTRSPPGDALGTPVTAAALATTKNEITHQPKTIPHRTRQVSIHDRRGRQARDRQRSGRTVALADGRRLDLAGGGELQGLGHVE
jgi:hypothetical protein